MDERLISQSLQEQARKDIPDDMNMWPEVQGKLGHAARSAARSRLSWVAVAVMAMLTIGIAAYAAALLLQGGYLDPGMQGASEADLVTVLNLQQTMEGQTVTLDYAYADSNRISFSLTASGTVPNDTGYSFGQIDVTDDQGHDFESMFGGGGGGGGGGGSGPTPALTDYSTNTYASLDASVITGNPESITLHIAVSLQEIRTTESEPMGTHVRDLGPFRFDITIPFIPGQVVEPDASATANGLTLRLERLVIAPSFTRSLVCFDPQPDVSDYNAALSLTVDGKPVSLGDPEVLAPFAQPPEGSPDGCYDLQINQSLYNLPGTWALSVDSLREYLNVSRGSGSNGTTDDYSYDGTPELLAQVRARLEPALAQYGITLRDVDGGLRFSVSSENADKEAIRQLANDVTQNIKPGPWTFTFTVPPAS